MALERVKARIAFNHLRCIDEADGLGTAEPYQWAVFFTIEGFSVTLDVGQNDHLVLRGVANTIATEGSLGNLGTTDVDAGQTVTIPTRIHSHGSDLNLEPIPLTPAAEALHPQLGSVGGLVGAVVALMENDDVTSADAEIAHKEFNDSVRRTINDALREFFVPAIVTNPSENDVALFMRNNLGNRIAHLVERRRGEWATFPNYQNKNRDDKVGVRTLLFLHQDFVGGRVHGISERFDDAGEFVLIGEAMGIEAAPHPETVVDLSDMFGSPLGAGSPAGLGMAGIETIVYRTDAGGLYQLWRNADGRTAGIGYVTPASSRAKGDPVLYAEPPFGHQIAVYRGNDDHLHVLYWAPGLTPVGHENLTELAGAPKAAGNPAAYLDSSNMHYVFYRGSNDHLNVIWSPAGGGSTGHADLTVDAGGAEPARGTPSAYVDSRGTNIVFYRGRDGHIRDLYWAGGDAPTAEDVSGFAGTPPAVGDPVAYYIPQHDLHQIVYRAAGGQLFELYWQGVNATVGRTLMQVPPASQPAPPAATDPVAYYDPATNVKHVVYRAANGHLIDLSWPVGSATVTVRDLTLLSLARLAGDSRPAAFVANRARHIVYLGIDRHVYEITS